jgi:FecR protein
MNCKVIIFSALFVISFQSIAAVGTITEQIQTPPTIQREKQTLAGSKGTGVELADAINTKQGKVGIVFSDNTKVQINENSKLVIDEFVYDPKKPTAGKLALNMAAGTVRYASGAIAHNNNNNVAINTPTATVAVRGTDFTATVDELGESTIILLPSCPRKNLLPDEIEKYCVTGKIEVSNEAGTVTLDQAFQGTKVVSRGIPPTRPVTLHLSEDAISNILILAPPFEIIQARKDQQAQNAKDETALSQDFLKGVDLGSVLAEQNQVIFDTTLTKNYLDQDFLESMLAIMNAELSAIFGNLLAPVNPILPDYKKGTGEVAVIDNALGIVDLCRTDSVNNTSCVQTPKTQNSTVTQSQSGGVVIINRINQGGNTFITTKQN